MIQENDPGERERCCPKGRWPCPGAAEVRGQAAVKKLWPFAEDAGRLRPPISIAYNSTKISNSSLE